MATVDRVLPWRWHAPAAAEELAPLLAAFRSHHPKASTGLIVRAYDVAAAAHTGQNRMSGETYINHPLAVARIVADIGLDDTTVVAALLHFGFLVLRDPLRVRIDVGNHLQHRARICLDVNGLGRLLRHLAATLSPASGFTPGHLR